MFVTIPIHPGAERVRVQQHQLILMVHLER